MGNPNPRIRATDDPELAKRLGFTHWDPNLGQYTAAPEAKAEASQPAAKAEQKHDAGGARTAKRSDA